MHKHASINKMTHSWDT